jgi:hypothetical protein
MSKMADFRGSFDDSLAALEDAIALQYAEVTIAELMQRDVDLKTFGSRARKRRSSRAKSAMKGEKDTNSNEVVARVGRPTIGAEARVCVQTSIALRTRDILAAAGMTLADVFDAYARRLMAHGG